ncbi:hypothetical protein AAZX31_09G163000 [Glycine max]|uniref:HMA domain-containing protein n=2 Tax=Glycine subgen. Soja TaxID=1462606 RepID=I1L487_SOYBN|nr:uncharacterized protein LOC100817981 isoform X2 [Glycine max]XP_028248508.1 uncharacterized protein LOC114425752 isoform X2 [Glycine soja]KAG4991959.1 hypothetical protein JHK87_025416 [Glycine soja]KAG5013341.1 hypothetical protein JHK86_025602 [Glycine max]KAG5134290.1 hypothetical protein JHK82_025478 [Glycine max]KAH1043556.1 hypothetical protein GYH30_025413 [Glycine max]KRH39131.1 hypothetical protein GLYMA_09G179900v4 [Glycine max]|eukprot:XP_006587486.1 uncharacterized protein LOC100817981 isoform X1 [Glycine max]
MKQKIVIKLQMDCDKCRNKALKIAAEVRGVTTVSLEGDDNDRVAVSGVNVDMVCLANQLKKKFSSVTILTVVDLVKEEEAKKKKDEEEKKKKEEAEKKRKEEEERLKKMLRSVLCKKCKSSSCHGKCDTACCTKCESIHCGGDCFIVCVNCDSPKCEGDCKPCINCLSSKCECECEPCPKPPSPCPKWCNCHKCYVPYQQPCYYPYPPQVVCYDTCPDSPCSIM